MDKSLVGTINSKYQYPLVGWMYEQKYQNETEAKILVCKMLLTEACDEIIEKFVADSVSDLDVTLMIMVVSQWIMVTKLPPPPPPKILFNIHKVDPVPKKYWLGFINNDGINSISEIIAGHFSTLQSFIHSGICISSRIVF